MNFTELYEKLITEAKAKYPNSNFIQNYDIVHNIRHLRVSEVFEELDMLDWEDREGFSWKDNTDVITDEVLEYVTEGFESYMRIMQNEDV